jgi:hypothetical protein
MTGAQAFTTSSNSGNTNSDTYINNDGSNSSNNSSNNNENNYNNYNNYKNYKNYKNYNNYNNYSSYINNKNNQKTSNSNTDKPSNNGRGGLVGLVVVALVECPAYARATVAQQRGRQLALLVQGARLLLRELSGVLQQLYPDHVHFANALDDPATETEGFASTSCAPQHHAHSSNSLLVGAAGPSAHLVSVAAKKIRTQGKIAPESVADPADMEAEDAYRRHLGGGLVFSLWSVGLGSLDDPMLGVQVSWNIISFCPF